MQVSHKNKEKQTGDTIRKRSGGLEIKLREESIPSIIVKGNPPPKNPPTQIKAQCVQTIRNNLYKRSPFAQRAENLDGGNSALVIGF